MSLHALSQAHADQIVTDGGGWVFGEGNRCTHWVHPTVPRCSPDCDYPYGAPPSSFVEACQPCETCDDEPGWVLTPHPSGRGYFADECPDCHDGKRIVTVRVECPDCHGEVTMYAPGPNGTVSVTCPFCHDGFVTVGQVVAVGEPLRVFHNDHTPAPLVPCIEVWDDDVAFIWTQQSIQQDVAHRLSLPPDVDPQSIVGQWALRVTSVSPPVRQ